MDSTFPCVVNFWECVGDRWEVPGQLRGDPGSIKNKCLFRILGELFGDSSTLIGWEKCLFGFWKYYSSNPAVPSEVALEPISKASTRL